MRAHAFIALPALIALSPAPFALHAPLAPRAPLAPPAPLYDPAPAHLWNRIHEHFRVRVSPDGSRHGFDTLDPLLWRETRYLLTGPSHAQAVRLLDEFLTTGGERAVRDPLKRAVFQNDMWAVFDWLITGTESEKRARDVLAARIARILRRVALTRKEIEALPDTYAVAVASEHLPALPRDLFAAEGPWVSVGGTQPMVPHHASELGRSAFLVFWNLPGGSVETLAYLRKLWDFRDPFVNDGSFQMARDGELRASLNPALPQPPDGTRLALVRRMLLIDNTGVVIPSNVVQSIQFRVVKRPDEFAEFKMSRARLFAGTDGGLVQVAADERDFLTFSSHGIDAFDKRFWRGPNRLGRVLDSCVSCHQTQFEPRTSSIRSLRHLLRPNAFVDPAHERWSRWFTQSAVAAEAKGRTYEWGVLNGLWRALPR